MGADHAEPCALLLGFRIILSGWESLEFSEPRTDMTRLTFLKVTKIVGLRKDCRKPRAEVGRPVLMMLMD